MIDFRNITVGSLLVLAIFTSFTLFSTAQTESLERAVIFAIDAEQETPSPNLGGASPAGTGAYVLNADGTELGITLTYSGLTGAPVAMHFHNAPAGTGGGVVQTICGNGPNPKLLDNCPSGTSGTISAIWEVPSDLLDAVLAGDIYFNLHTAQNGGGEVRGQLVVPEE